jgi:hypothetical protein
MAYVPGHIADVFISYSHEDDFAWIEGFKRDLEIILSRKLRGRTKPEIFFDANSLRVGRQFDRDIPDCLDATGFFIALVSRPYNRSTYCRHKELARFLGHHSPSSGRTIQVRLDREAVLPLQEVLAVEFANASGPFRNDSGEFKDALMRVCEPIVTELDRLYAQSKMIFLAWSVDPDLERERERLQLEIDGRQLRIFPEAVAAYDGPIRLRDALQECAASVHFFGPVKDDFAETQLEAANRLARPCVLASRNPAETRRGPGGSPSPIFLDQGNPTVAIANAIDVLMGRGKRDDPDPKRSLGKMPLFLVFKPDADSSLGLRVRQRIVNRGPFEIIEPPRDASATARYEEIVRAKAAVLCWGRAERSWFDEEFEALNQAIAIRQLYNLRRGLFISAVDGKDHIEPLDTDSILSSTAELDSFLTAVQGAAA